MQPKRLHAILALLVPLLLAGDGEPLRDGQELLGTAMPRLSFERWIGTKGGNAPDTAGRPVLYRWWTSGCSFCEKSLPAIESLRKRYEPDGLRVVAVYHPKPVREVADDAIRSAAEEMGYGGTVAVDEDWSELKRAWLAAGKRPATSVTFLVDGEGVVRFVHPGPALFTSDDPEDAAENRPFAELDGTIRKLMEPALGEE